MLTLRNYNNMENLDIIIYTVIVSGTFLFFIISSIKEFTYMSKNDIKKGEVKDPYRKR